MHQLLSRFLMVPLETIVSSYFLPGTIAGFRPFAAAFMQLVWRRRSLTGYHARDAVGRCLKDALRHILKNFWQTYLGSSFSSLVELILL